MSQVALPTASTKARVKAAVPEQVDVAIIGTGTGGLMAGARLALAGLRVALFDAHYVAGGCATQFSRGHGAARYCFDIGLHYIGDCGPDGVIPRLLHSVGVTLDVLPMDPDGFDTLVFPDFRFRVPVDVDLYRQRLLDLFPSEKVGIDRYLRFHAEIDRLGSSRAQGLRLGIEAALHGRLAARFSGGTLSAFLDTCTRDIQLRAVMLGQSGDYGLPPGEVSAALHAGLVNHYFKGAFYPKGGGQVISDRLAEAIEAHGGTIHLRHPVRQVLVGSDGRANGLRYADPRGDEHEIHAGVVLSNADIKQTYLELLPHEHLPAGVVRRADDWKMAGALFMTYLGVRKDLAAEGFTKTNFWQFDGYDFDEFFRTDRGIRPRGCYITSASIKDPDTPGHAPPGVTNVEVMTVLPGSAEAWGIDPTEVRGPHYRKTEAYLAHKQAVEADMIRRLDALFPGSAEAVVFRESATPITQTRYTWASDGSGYGLAATPDQFLGKRPGYRAEIPGVYLCGASTRSGHGIVGAMMSGAEAAKRILADRAGQTTQA